MDGTSGRRWAMGTGSRVASVRPPADVVLSLALCVAALLWFASNLPGSWAPPLIGWILTTLCPLGTAVVCWRAARTPGLAGPTRRFWRSVGFISALVAAATAANARDA